MKRNEKIFGPAAHKLPDDMMVPVQADPLAAGMLQRCFSASADGNYYVDMEKVAIKFHSLSSKHDDLKALQTRLYKHMEVCFESACEVLGEQGYSRKGIEHAFQVFCKQRTETERELDPRYLRHIFLLHWACEEVAIKSIQLETLEENTRGDNQQLRVENDTLRVENDTLQVQITDARRLLLAAQNKLDHDTQEQQSQMKQLKDQISMLQRVHDEHQQHCQEVSDMAHRLKQLSSVDCLQDRVDEAVAKRVAAVEERHAAQLREKDEALQQAAAQLNAKDAEMLVAKFWNLVSRYIVSRYSTQRLSWEIAKKEAQQKITSIRQITGHWYRLVLESLLGRSKRREFKLLKRNIALTRKMTALIQQNENLSASASLLQEQDVETPGNPHAAGAKHISLEEVVYECQLCLETDGPYVRLSPCGHVFCNGCVHEKDDSLDKKGSFCPTCRTVQFTSTDKTHLC